MAVLSLPLSFNNSFWSQDYRRGLEVLFEKLEQGVAENDEIVAFVRARAIAEGQLAVSLTNPMLTGPQATGFGADDGASLLVAFRGLQYESSAQGEVHKAISKELHSLVADPFDEWAQAYKERLKQSKSTAIDNWLRSYERSQADIAKLKNQYLSKTRRADEAEDDAKFAPNVDIGDKYTTSPRLNPRDARSHPNRTASVSERIAQRLKEIQRKSASVLSGEDSKPVEEEKHFEVEEKPLPKLDKGKGKAIGEESIPPTIESPPPLSPLLPPAKLGIIPSSSPMPPPPPSPILLAGLSLPPAAISSLLSRAAAELPLRSVRFPLLGEYQNCFTGEEFVAWLNENVQGFGGSLDRAEDAARDLTEREGLLRRIGELGNQFEDADDAFYQFRSKAFDIEGKAHENNLSPTRSQFAPVADNIIKKSNTFVNLVSKALASNTHGGEPAYMRARQEADDADRAYRVGVRKLDRQRLRLEDRIEEALKTLQRWESERLQAVKTVLLQYQGTLANLPKGLEESVERSATRVAAFQPESDLTALIERYRTGPFRPAPQVYESVAHDESDVVFGIDLRKWADGGWVALTRGEERKELIPPVLTALLEALQQAYGGMPDDADKRKAWIYEVPLPAVHHLRETLNAVPLEKSIPVDLLTKYDAPVVAATVKLWALELDPPLALWEGWDEFRKLYPTVGSAGKTQDGELSEEQRVQELSVALLRLPRVHLYVLDAIVSHLKTLIDSTTVDEPNEVYITKLALSVGRSIIRPKYETEITIQDRHPTLLFMDLVTKYDQILPPTIARKKRESERKVPFRKRTAPVDMRLSRSRLSGVVDPKELLAVQHAAQNPRSPSPNISPLPPLPANVTTPATLATPEPTSIPEAFPIVSPVPVLAAVPPPPAVDPQFVADIPPPPPIPQPVTPEPVEIPTPAVDLDAVPLRPSFKTPPLEDDDFPPRPSFKEPPPEDDFLPTRPSFKEPPSEDDSPPTRPSFTEPPAEAADAPSATSIAVTPPTPQPKAAAQRSRRRDTARSGSSSPLHASRSPSPNEDRPLSSARATLTRAGSSQAQQGGVRAPRISKGPRTPGGSVSSLVSTFNNRNSAGQSPPASPSYASKRMSGTVSPTGVGKVRGARRTGAFSRRTMASDAEDEVVDR